MEKKKKTAQPREPVSLAPLTPDQALTGLLKVKPADMAKVEAEDRAAISPKKPRRRPAGN